MSTSRWISVVPVIFSIAQSAVFIVRFWYDRTRNYLLYSIASLLLIAPTTVLLCFCIFKENSKYLPTIIVVVNIAESLYQVWRLLPFRPSPANFSKGLHQNIYYSTESRRWGWPLGALIIWSVPEVILSALADNQSSLSEPSYQRIMILLGFLLEYAFIGWMYLFVPKSPAKLHVLVTGHEFLYLAVVITTLVSLILYVRGIVDFTTSQLVCEISQSITQSMLIFRQIVTAAICVPAAWIFGFQCRSFLVHKLREPRRDQHQALSSSPSSVIGSDAALVSVYSYVI